MGGHHAAGVRVEGDSAIHRLPAHLKVVALLGFVLAVVATPRETIWPYLEHLALLLAVAGSARVPLRRLAGGLRVEAPFVLLALLMPFVATGPRTVVLGVQVSQPGLWAAWALAAKATLGVLAAVTLAATTTAPAILDGLRRLRLPPQLVEIAGFMVRYADVIGDQWRRMGIARAARGFNARTLSSWPVLARSLGSLFIRTYERGERVHLAMLSRGYAGSPPSLAHEEGRASEWLAASALPAASVLVAALSRGVG